MALATDDEDMVKYQFQADDDEWRAWKDTVPRSKSLEQRINELIRADTDGRVLTEEEPGLDEFREAVREAREAYEDVDGDGVGDAIARLEELTGVNDGDVE